MIEGDDGPATFWEYQIIMACSSCSEPLHMLLSKAVGLSLREGASDPVEQS